MAVRKATAPATKTAAKPAAKPVGRKPASREKGVAVNLSGITTRKRIHKPGIYHFVVADASLEEGTSAQYFSLTLEVQGGPEDGGQCYDNLSLDPKALWKLKSFLEAAGEETDGELDLKPSTFKGLEVDAVVFIDTSYDGQPRAKISEYLTDASSVEGEEYEEDDGEAEEEGESEEEEEGEEEASEDGEAELTADDINSMDAGELQEINEAYELGLKLKGPVTLQRKNMLKALTENGLI